MRALFHHTPAAWRRPMALVILLTALLHAKVQAAEPEVNPTGDAGVLKAQVETGGGYSPHSGSASRVVPDLRVPGAVDGGLDFIRNWNSIHGEGLPFGAGGWTHSWHWQVTWEQECQNCEIDGAPIYYKNIIKITFPDGSTREFWQLRGSAGPEWWDYGHPDRWTDNAFGPKYHENWESDPASADVLRQMAPWGNEFWLYLADGGAVHFQNDLATEVIDQNGLRTVLEYEQGGYWVPYHYIPAGGYWSEPPRLKRVIGPNGHTLTLEWGYPEGVPYPAITKVHSGAGGDGRTVQYHYSSISGRVALTEVQYWGDPEWALYNYSPYDHTTYHHTGSGLMLEYADDPRFEGAMRTIRYTYRRTEDPFPNAYYGGSRLDYHDPSPYAISEERSKTGQMVSRLAIGGTGPNAGQRYETRGAGGARMFYFGSSGGIEPGGYFTDGSNGSGYWTPPEANPVGAFRNRGFELAKLTDFVDDPRAAGTPFEFQRNYGSLPRRLFDAKGTFTELLYLMNGSNRLAEVRNVGSDGSKRTYNWLNPGNSEPQDFSRIPNRRAHWLFSQTDENNQTTTYTRDSLRRVKDISYPDGSSEHFDYNHLNQVTDHRLASNAWQHYRYDGAGFMYEEWNDADGYEARKEYIPDALGRVWQMTDGRARAHGTFTVRLTYNARHQIVQEEYPATDGGFNPTKGYGYDRYGNCTGIKNELGDWTTYEYDEYRRCTSMTEPLDANNHTYPGYQANRTWEWAYDRVGPDGITYYFAASHTSKQWRLQIEPAFNLAGDRRMTARQYDYNDRLTFEQTGWIKTAAGEFVFTEDGEHHSLTYDANGNKRTFTDPRGRVTTYEHDKRDRLKKTIAPLNRVTENWYDWAGNKTQVQFPDGRTQRWEGFDAFGQAWRFIDERNQLTDLYYQWGPMKKLVNVITHRDKDGGGTEDQWTSFWYTGIGRPETTGFPDGSSEQTLYKYGQPESYKTRKGPRKWMHYDARGRERWHSWENDAAPLVVKNWDNAHRLIHTRNKYSSIDYTHDDAGQVRSERTSVSGSWGTAEVKYDRYANGEVARFVHPMGWWSRRDYTARGQLKAVGWDDGWNWNHKLVDYSYHPDGKVAEQYHGNGVRSWKGYDGRGMINGTHTHRQQPYYQHFTYRDYGRDARDRMTWFRKSGDSSGGNPRENGRGDRYEYDPEGQLTRASYEAPDPVTSGNGYAADDNFGGGYDALGNRRGNNWQASRGWTWYNRRDNGLNQYLNWSPGWTNYDGNGALTQEGGISATYNALNQPVSIWSATTGQTLRFGYDPLGRCVKRWTGPSDWEGSNPATYLYYDGWNLVQEGPSAGNAEWIYFHGGRVDEMVAAHHQPPYGGWNYYHYDARGHTIGLTDWWGNLVEQYDYHAFGSVFTYDGAGNWVGAGATQRGNRFLFTGREWLKDLGIYDYRHRMYHPELGRFLQPDPLHFGAGDYNLYRYCHNDPINKSDPMGLYVTYSDKWSDKDVENFNREFAKQWGTAEGRATWESRYNSKDEFKVSPDRSTGSAERGAANFKITGPELRSRTFLESVGEALRRNAESLVGMGQGNQNFEKKQQGDNTGVNKVKQDAAREAGLNREQQRLLHDTDTSGMSYREIRNVADKIKSGQITGGSN